MNKSKMNEEKEDTNPYFDFYSREIQIIKNQLSEEEKNVPEFQPVIIKFEKPIKEITEIFSSQGHSGGSAPFYSGALSRAIKNILSFTPLSPITGEDSEWVLRDGYGGPQSFQNNRLSSVFKESKEGRAYYLDAIIFRGQNGSCFSGNSVKLNNRSNLTSRQYIKFPFTPKTFYVDVIETEWADKEEKVKKAGGGWWTSVIKDETQLEEVFKYYEKYEG